MAPGISYPITVISILVLLPSPPPPEYGPDFGTTSITCPKKETSAASVPKSCVVDPQKLWCLPSFLGSDAMPFHSQLPGGAGNRTLKYKGVYPMESI